MRKTIPTKFGPKTVEFDGVPTERDLVDAKEYLESNAGRATGGPRQTEQSLRIQKASILNHPLVLSQQGLDRLHQQLAPIDARLSRYPSPPPTGYPPTPAPAPSVLKPPGLPRVPARVQIGTAVPPPSAGPLQMPWGTALNELKKLEEGTRLGASYSVGTVRQQQAYRDIIRAKYRELRSWIHSYDLGQANGEFDASTRPTYKNAKNALQAMEVNRPLWDTQPAVESASRQTQKGSTWHPPTPNITLPSSTAAPYNFNGTDLSQDPFPKLGFTREALDKANQLRLGFVVSRSGREIPITQALYDLERISGMTPAQAGRMNSSDEEYENAATQSSYNAYGKVGVGETIGFQKGTIDSRVPRGEKRKILFDNTHYKNGQLITSSSQLRDSVNNFRDKVKDKISLNGNRYLPGTVTAVADFISGTLVDVATSIPNGFADLQTVGDRDETASNKLGASINVTLQYLLSPASGALGKSVLKPLLSAVEPLGRFAKPALDAFKKTLLQGPREALSFAIGHLRMKPQDAQRVVNALTHDLKIRATAAMNAANRNTKASARAQFEHNLGQATSKGILNAAEQDAVSATWRHRGWAWAFENGRSPEEYYQKFAPRFDVDGKIPEGSLHQIEDLLRGVGLPGTESIEVPNLTLLLEGQEKSRLVKVARWIDKFAKSNPVFRLPIKELTDDEVVEGIAEHTNRELSSLMAANPDLKAFYHDDIRHVANPLLQEFALKSYGRHLSEGEVKLYHLLSSFGSPSRPPVTESSVGLHLFDRYMRTGELSALSGTQATKQIRVLNSKGRWGYIDSGLPVFDKGGNPVMAKVLPQYALPALTRVNKVLAYFGGDLDSAMDWLGSYHTRDELVGMFGKLGKSHEYLDQNGGFGIFGAFGDSGPKLGSYVLNRWGNYTTVTKDMWFARTMARLTGQPLVDASGNVLSVPWKLNKDGMRLRKLADKAWRRVADAWGTEPADIQQAMWNAEQLLYNRLGIWRKPSYVSDGLRKGIRELEAGRSGRPDFEKASVYPRPLRTGPAIAGSGGVERANLKGNSGASGEQTFAQRGGGSRASVKGAVSFPVDGQPVIHLLTGVSDISTILHESSHIWRRTLDSDSLNIIERHFGKLGTEGSEEGFARAFERYLHDGFAPNASLRGVFDHFRVWLGNIYSHLKGSPIEANVHPEVRQVFDRMLGYGQVHSPLKVPSGVQGTLLRNSVNNLGNAVRPPAGRNDNSRGTRGPVGMNHSQPNRPFMSNLLFGQ